MTESTKFGKYTKHVNSRVRRIFARWANTCGRSSLQAHGPRLLQIFRGIGALTTGQSPTLRL